MIILSMNQVLNHIMTNCMKNEVYADVSNKGCILDKRGICGGISIILSELCNRVGITAYPSFWYN